MVFFKFVDRLIAVLVPLVSLFLVWNFRLAPTAWLATLLLVEGFIASFVWPGLWSRVWKALGERRVQLGIVASSAFIIVLVLSGVTAAVAAAHEAPENEFGSWGEWLNIAMGLPLTVINTVIAWQLFRVTRVLTLNTVLTDLYDSIFARICPDGRVPDFSPYTSRIATEQIRVMLLRSLGAIKPEELAQLFHTLTEVFALQVIDFNGAAGQHAVDRRGLPQCRPYIDPREEAFNKPPEVVRFIRLHTLTPLLTGRKVTGDLKGCDFSWASFEVDFSDSDLRDVNFISSVLTRCAFCNSDLRDLRVRLSERELMEARSHGCADVEKQWFARFIDCDFTGARMTPELYGFLEKNGSGNNINEAIICLPDGNEVTAKNWRRTDLNT